MRPIAQGWLMWVSLMSTVGTNFVSAEAARERLILRDGIELRETLAVKRGAVTDYSFFGTDAKGKSVHIDLRVDSHTQEILGGRDASGKPINSSAYSKTFSGSASERGDTPSNLFVQLTENTSVGKKNRKIIEQLGLRLDSPVRERLAVVESELAALKEQTTTKPSDGFLLKQVRESARKSETNYVKSSTENRKLVSELAALKKENESLHQKVRSLETQLAAAPRCEESFPEHGAPSRRREDEALTHSRVR